MVLMIIILKIKKYKIKEMAEVKSIKATTWKLKKH